MLIRNFVVCILGALTILLFGTGDAFAASQIDSGDTAWIIVASALVMLMTPGLGFFYSGMVHSTNVVATIMHSYMKLCVISLMWVLFGYSLAFGPSISGFIGNLDMAGFGNVGMEPTEGSTIPHVLFALFQGLFAVITAAIITGAFAERVRLGSILLFSAIWVVVVYAPVAHWVWGGGWIAEKLGALDFAGGAVVHINSGIAGLVAALCLGRRVSVRDGATDSRPHNLPMAILGASLLWFGWFGFNAGSALAADGLAALAFANTNIAAASGAVAWFVVEYLHKEKSTSLGIISGSIAGLVAITPAAGFVTPLASICIGIGGGMACYWAVAIIKPRLGYDDSLDAFGIHGVGGIWGALATGIFATTDVNSGGADGLLYGNPSLLVAQIISIIAVIAYSAIATYGILVVVRKFVHIRVSAEEEKAGLDSSQHGETGYSLS